MSFEDRDYLMRQIQLIAKGIGKFLDIFSIKEILKSEYAIEDELTDREIETIVYMTRMEEMKTAKNLTEEELSRDIGFEQDRLAALFLNEETATEKELDKLVAYLAQKDL